MSVEDPQQPLAWLGDAETGRAKQNELWLELRNDLRQRLGDLEVDQFLIANTAVWAQESGNFRLGRYVQYKLSRSDSGDRYLTSEVSAAKYQSPEIRQTESTTERLIARGWPINPDGGNHARAVSWPEGIDAIVQGSMEVLQDIWEIPHPRVVTFDEGAEDLIDGLVPASAADWISDGSIVVASDADKNFAVIERWCVELGIDTIRLEPEGRMYHHLRFDIERLIAIGISYPDDLIRVRCEVLRDESLLSSWTMLDFQRVKLSSGYAGFLFRSGASLILETEMPAPVMVRDNLKAQLDYTTEIASCLAEDIHRVAEEKAGGRVAPASQA
jgi:hypothetical protein